MLQDGVAFEAHPQNAVARFSLAPPHELRGFIIRDFGGLRVHPPTLLASSPAAGACPWAPLQWEGMGGDPRTPSGGDPAWSSPREGLAR